MVLVDRAELDFFIALMSPRPVRVVILAPGIDVCKARNAGRAPEERFDFDGYERLEAEMASEFGDVAWWLDTSDQTARETADLILARMENDAALVEPMWKWVAPEVAPSSSKARLRAGGPRFEVLA